MPLYVLALTDEPAGIDRIGERRLQDVTVAGIHAICQRRNGAPPLTDKYLRQQHGDVIAISRRVRAVLPVRFGALLTKNELTTLIRTNEVDIRRGLDEVRDCVQMTVRVPGTVRPLAPTPASTGRQYLEQRRRAASPVLPSRARVFLDAVRPLVTRERQEHGTPGLLASVYHLLQSKNIDQYQSLVRTMTGPDVITSGPWPPFAFTPRLG